MSDFARTQDIEMDRIVQALETAPDVAMPDNFAARVIARVPRQPQRRFVLRQAMQTEARIGRRLALAALVLLVGSMLLLAPHTAGSEIWLLLQAVLFTQLVALLLWMGISYKRLL